ncbi:cytochrome c oxidase assembly protein [Ketobacter sp. MCCC 1A13808]|uniref:cytochrome c oxidase assembly protein n=1 Tax=Ketobacter sp. MCCC 1A13808 TaxID=2602738 RepID=UPI000F1CB031|nr:cytochrome c oxidase assembly protein [Ketobacter sp. MCCC 1A13808]MVF11289.1 cytochrome c oxidase assembly protein [Ketobacter sp. MCCC 1A13808]RLP53580.1 MAG: cytochrome c oxidase assembly protein [Ketobacter sp.]
MDEQHTQQSNQRMVIKLLLIVVGMFIFAVGVLPPMYDAICDFTGLNGKTSNEAADAKDAVVQEDREVTIQFLADTDPAMVWDFKPNTFSIKVNPGQIHKVDFHVRNPASHLIVGQAIPSVAPANATPYFKKTECFCFHSQELEGGTEMDMPLIFYVDPGLPKSVRTITLSYQLYDITAKSEKAALAAN